MKRLIGNQRGASRTLNLVIILVVGLALILVGYYSRTDRGLSSSVEYTPADGPAILRDSASLYKLINNDKQYAALSNDLAVFGRKTIEKYKSGKVKDVNFRVTNTATKNGAETTFEGKYDESKDTMSVSVKKLNNSKIQTKIKNKKTNGSIDNQLPSNSKRNQFIGSLPLKKNNYSISYLEASDGFFITINEGNTETTKSEALAVLRSSLGLTTLADENLSIASWGPNGVPVTSGNPDKK